MKTTNLILLLIGIGMVVVASTCFKEVPLIGTVFLLPGESFLKAKMADPALRYALYLAGCAFTACGFFMKQDDNGQESAEETQASATEMNLGRIKEAKVLFDSGAISEEEFNTIKARLIR